MSYSDSFCEHFLRSYHQSRKAFDQKRWEEIWTDGNLWNHFMLWNPEPPQAESVIPSAAKKMGLRSRAEGETFHFDSVFFGTQALMIGKYPLPIIAAIEHEHYLSGFHVEILKLAYIRCPLKVGITYLVARSPAPPRDLIASAEKKIGDLASKTEQLLNVQSVEDPKGEYVFLLGVEPRPFELDWHALRFTAGQGAASAKWVLLS